MTAVMGTVTVAGGAVPCRVLASTSFGVRMKLFHPLAAGEAFTLSIGQAAPREGRVLFREGLVVTAELRPLPAPHPNGRVLPAAELARAFAG